MDKPTRYCEYCGKPLNEKARFCGRCGKPVDLGQEQQVSPPAQAAPRPTSPPPDQRQSQSQPPRPSQSLPPSRQASQPPRPAQPLPSPPLPPPYQVAAPTEVVCGVIPGAYQRKGALGLGQQGFTLVLTNYRVIFAIQTGQMLQDQVRYARDVAKQQGKGFFGQWGAQFSASISYYMQQPPQAILGEQPGNFFILNNQLRSVKFHVIHNADRTNSDYRLDFDAVTGKVSVMFSMIDEKKAKQALTQVFGDRVHWDRGFFS